MTDTTNHDAIESAMLDEMEYGDREIDPRLDAPVPLGDGHTDDDPDSLDSLLAEFGL